MDEKEFDLLKDENEKKKMEQQKVVKRKRDRQHVQLGLIMDNVRYPKSSVAMYLITRILAANSLGCSRPATNDIGVYLQSVLDQVSRTLDSNKLAEMRRQMIVCWNENSISRTMPNSNKNTVPLCMELGWINTRDDNRLKKKINTPEKSEFCINSDLIEAEVKDDKQMFFIHGGNGTRIIAEHLKSKGWIRTTNVKGGYKLKWVKNRMQIKYKVFREGEQMVNHIPSTWRLSNKIHLVGILKDLDARQRPGLLKMTDVIPETYRMNLIEEQFKFKQIYREGEVWICKPAALNQGKGIYLIRKLQDFNQRYSHLSNVQVSSLFTVGSNLPLRVVQRYIHNPLLLNGRKADIRCFMLIASTSPFLILTHPGYVRLSCRQYNVESEMMGIHLTNQFVQKKDACYSFMRDDTIWSIDQLNTYMNHYILSYHNLDSDWVLNVMTRQLRRLMLHCFLAAKNHLETKVGYFELLGFDFVIDDNLKVWLLEVNVNPSCCTNCLVLRDLIPHLLRETLDICIECFEKNKRRKPLIPLKKLKRFSLLYCEEQNYHWPKRNITKRK